MIHTSLSPNTESDDLWLAFTSLVFPWNWLRWKRGKKIAQLEKEFRHTLGVQHATSFHCGRDGLFVLLKAMGIGEGDEVILQAYTCIVVPNAIQFTGATPVYVDIEEHGFNIDPKLIEASITKQTKALIVQHTFGEPANIDAIQKICKKHQLFLIEDCAHALSATSKGKKVGTFGDAAIWSFGRDKIISSVWGGMVTTDDSKLAAEIQKLHDRLKSPSLLQIKQSLLHPLLFALIKPVYRFKLGKAFLLFFQKTQIIPKVIYPGEKTGKPTPFSPQRMANILARLASHQLKKLDRFHQYRIKLAQLYRESLQDTANCQLPTANSEAAWLRYTIRTPHAQQILKSAQRKGMYLGDWYRTVLAPPVADYSDFQYRPGSCPRAEKAAQETLNLPTHIQMDEKKVNEVIRFVKEN